MAVSPLVEKSLQNTLLMLLCKLKFGSALVTSSKTWILVGGGGSLRKDGVTTFMKVVFQRVVFT